MAMPIAIAVIDELNEEDADPFISKVIRNSRISRDLSESGEVTDFYSTTENFDGEKIKKKKNLEKAIIFAVTYACNIGGLATVNGSGTG